MTRFSVTFAVKTVGFSRPVGTGDHSAPSRRMPGRDTMISRDVAELTA